MYHTPTLYHNMPYVMYHSMCHAIDHMHLSYEMYRIRFTIQITTRFVAYELSDTTDHTMYHTLLHTIYHAFYNTQVKQSWFRATEVIGFDSAPVRLDPRSPSGRCRRSPICGNRLKAVCGSQCTTWARKTVVFCQCKC